VGWDLSPFGTAATTGLLHQPQTIDDGDCGAVGGMKIGKRNWSTRRKPAPTPLCPPQIPYDQTRARTQAAAVGSQRLTAWAMARPTPDLSVWGGEDNSYLRSRGYWENFTFANLLLRRELHCRCHNAHSELFFVVCSLLFVMSKNVSCRNIGGIAYATHVYCFVGDELVLRSSVS
jgi:hypothetical protein